MEQHHQSPTGTKILAMIVVLLIDLGLNSTLDYDVFNDKYNGHTATRLLLGLFGLQVVIEIAIFLILFLAMADTFLFRVGLLGLLVKKFRTVLIMHPIYLTLTIATGAYRVKQYSAGATLSTLWKDNTFIGLSYAQKIVAIPYYLLNFRAAMKLGDPIYFNKEAWIALVKQHKRAQNQILGRRPLV